MRQVQGPHSAYCKAIGLHACATPCPHWGASRSSIPGLTSSTNSHVHHRGQVQSAGGSLAGRLAAYESLKVPHPMLLGSDVLIAGQVCPGPLRMEQWLGQPTKPLQNAHLVPCMLIKGGAACNLPQALHGAPFAHCRYGNHICKQPAKGFHSSLLWPCRWTSGCTRSAPP